MAQGISETYHEAKKDLEACAEKVGTSMVQYVAKGADVAAKVEDISSGALASAAGLGKGALKLGGAALATTVGNTIYHNIRSDPEKNERVKAAQHANTRAKMSNDGFKAQQREEQAFNAANDIVNNIVRPALEEGKAHVAVYCNDQALISNFKTLLANDRELRDQIGQLSFGVELQRLISKLEGVLEEDEQRYQAQRDTPPIRKAYVFLSYTGTAASDGMMMHGGRGRMGPRFSKMGTIVGELSGGQYRHAISGDFEYTQPDGKRLPLRKVDPAQLYRLLLVCPLFIKHAYLVDFRAHVANRSLGHGVSGTLFSAAGRAKVSNPKLMSSAGSLLTIFALLSDGRIHSDNGSQDWLCQDCSCQDCICMQGECNCVTRPSLRDWSRPLSCRYARLGRRHNLPGRSAF